MGIIWRASHLRFTKEIDLDGSILDPEATANSIGAVLEELKTYIEIPTEVAVAV